MELEPTTSSLGVATHSSRQAGVVLRRHGAPCTEYTGEAAICVARGEWRILRVAGIPVHLGAGSETKKIKTGNYRGKTTHVASAYRKHRSRI